MGTLLLTVQGSVLTSNMIAPTVTPNGYPVPTSYGENALPVYPGPIRVAVQAQWMRAYGQAAIDVDVRPGEAVHVWYAAPWHQFTTGSIGFEKQRRKGAGALAAMLVVLLLVAVVLPVLVAVL
jgi:hypothetical protein